MDLRQTIRGKLQPGNDVLVVEQLLRFHARAHLAQEHLWSIGARPTRSTKKWYGTSGNSFVAAVEYLDNDLGQYREVAVSFFVTRGKSNLKAQRRYSHAVNRSVSMTVRHQVA